MPFGTGGPDQKTGVYESADGSLRIRFDALQRDNRNIREQDLQRGFFQFDADRILFIAFVEKGDLNPTECLRFVQVKRGTIALRDRVRIRQLGQTQRNPLTEDWGIDDVDGDGQLGSARRRDGLVSTSTCDRPSSNGIYPYQVSCDYNVEFILYVVNCCGGEGCAEDSKKKKPAGKAKEAAPQVLFALPWKIRIQGHVPFGGMPASGSYSQVMGEVQVAPPDQSLEPVIPAVIADPICRPISVQTGSTDCR